jgi:carbamoyltransferase
MDPTQASELAHMSLVLGLNTYHADAAACVVRDGRLIAAAEEERFRRIKHWAGFPTQAIAYCMKEAGARLDDLDAVGINRDPRANLLRKVGFVLARRPDAALLFDRIKNARAWSSTEERLEAAMPGQRLRVRIDQIEHHMAHLASAFLVSPFDQALVMSVDGMGDFSSACWGVGHGSEISVDGRIFFPHSLGIFYEAMTQYLGFVHYGDEYKVMGLAAYGQPRFVQQMRQIVRLEPGGTFTLDLDYFRHGREKLDYSWSDCAPTSGRLHAEALEALLGPSRRSDEPITDRHKDIACGVQTVYEQAFFSLVNSLYKRHRLDRLALAGGCAMNSVANGRLYVNTPVRKLYVQAAAGDAGGAIGAAFLALQRHAPSNDRAFRMDHALWGPGFSDAEVASLLEQSGAVLDGQRCSRALVPDDISLCQRVARLIADGKVVGWFQGRMEWGPRALGNRSILCDPRRADMKDILNVKIKRRESFRPFAPSIHREAVADWFETDDDVPFMTQVFQIRADRRHLIPAVTHVDGSGRLQTVTRETNPKYYQLIEAFAGLTGVPILVNTSFNENEPVVCRPGEALDCFIRTGMDALVLGNWLVER